MATIECGKAGFSPEASNVLHITRKRGGPKLHTPSRAVIEGCEHSFFKKRKALVGNPEIRCTLQSPTGVDLVGTAAGTLIGRTGVSSGVEIGKGISGKVKDVAVCLM